MKCMEVGGRQATTPVEIKSTSRQSWPPATIACRDMLARPTEGWL